MKEETKIKYAEICKGWDELGLSNTPALYAARRLGVDPGTLRMALKVYRRGEYDPNKFKHHPRANYVYESCKFCGDSTCNRVSIFCTDEVKRERIKTVRVYLCSECMRKFLKEL